MSLEGARVRRNFRVLARSAAPPRNKDLTEKIIQLGDDGYECREDSGIFRFVEREEICDNKSAVTGYCYGLM